MNPRPQHLFGLLIVLATASILILTAKIEFKTSNPRTSITSAPIASSSTSTSNTSAFVTYLAHEGEAGPENGYFQSVRLLIRSIKQQFPPSTKPTSFLPPPIIVLVISETGPKTRQILKSEGALVQQVNYKSLTPPYAMGRLGRYVHMFGKLILWNMTEYSQLIFIDGDVIVQGDLKKLLTARPPNADIAAVNDFGEVYQMRFNGGFFIVKPSISRFEDMISLLDYPIELRGMAEQEWLNWYWGRSFYELDSIYNMQLLFCSEEIVFYPEMDWDDAILVHFKGWEREKSCITKYQLELGTHFGMLYDRKLVEVGLKS
ncbi:UNVERIFIED_CONTAM: hypothetical protein HDU68_009456 [Siphonaria sp. JEL0065]|nr:hypothetical protein HDU68_009456 [Siphonaria sp. JEL0065]